MSTERRQYIRQESLNLLDYFVVDDQGRQGIYSMGRTLNVNQGGLLMETHIPLAEGQLVVITLGLKDQLIDVMGRIVYTTHEAGRHQNGVAFSQLSDNDRTILNTYMAAFHAQYPASATDFPPPHDIG